MRDLENLFHSIQWELYNSLSSGMEVHDRNDVCAAERRSLLFCMKDVLCVAHRFPHSFLGYTRERV